VIWPNARPFAFYFHFQVDILLIENAANNLPIAAKSFAIIFSHTLKISGKNPPKKIEGEKNVAKATIHLLIYFSLTMGWPNK